MACPTEVITSHSREIVTVSPRLVVGAGPAGLVAAATLARTGEPATMLERHTMLGQRHHGDFQGLENWSSPRDVLDRLAALGVAADFAYRPFHKVTFYDARLRPAQAPTDPSSTWYAAAPNPAPWTARSSGRPATRAPRSGWARLPTVPTRPASWPPALEPPTGSSPATPSTPDCPTRHTRSCPAASPRPATPADLGRTSHPGHLPVHVPGPLAASARGHCRRLHPPRRRPRPQRSAPIRRTRRRAGHRPLHR